MKRPPTVLVVPLAGLLSLLLCACTSFNADMVTICESESLAGISRDPKLTAAPQDKKDEVTARWIFENIHTPEAKALMDEVWKAPAGDRAQKLREAAKRAAIAACPLAGAFERRAIPVGSAAPSR